SSMRCCPPGTKCSERRIRTVLGSRLAGTAPAHHRVAPRAHDELAVLVLRAVLERHDAPLRARFRLALVDDLGLRVDRVAVEDGPRELDLLEPQVAHGGAERRLADGAAPRDAEGGQAG